MASEMHCARSRECEELLGGRRAQRFGDILTAGQIATVSPEAMLVDGDANMLSVKRAVRDWVDCAPTTYSSRTLQGGEGRINARQQHAGQMLRVFICSDRAGELRLACRARGRQFLRRGGGRPSKYSSSSAPGRS